jgi:hypothetical protein
LFVSHILSSFFLPLFRSLFLSVSLSSDECIGIKHIETYDVYAVFTPATFHNSEDHS